MMAAESDRAPVTVLGTREHADRLAQSRHPGVRHALQWLTYSHLPSVLQRYSAPFYAAAVDLITEISSDSPELTTALNKMIEAKDSAVRAGIKDSTRRAGSVPRPQAVVDPLTFGDYGPGQPQPRRIEDEGAGGRTDEPGYKGNAPRADYTGRPMHQIPEE